MRALVVDDVADNREILARVLKRVGAEVVSVADGFEAIEAARRQELDIIFLDIRMPGIGGVETLERLLSEHGADAFKTVAVTASALAHQRQEYLEAGFDEPLDKDTFTLRNLRKKR